MFKDASDLSLEVSDRFLIMNIEDFTRHRGMPVPHHRIILLVVMSEIQHVVGEVLATSEQLLISTKAIVERVASGIDDGRIRQNEVGKTHHRKVIRQFIRKHRLVDDAMPLTVLDVLLSVGPQILVAPNETNSSLLFTVTNSGNGNDEFELFIDSVLAGDDFDPLPAIPAIYFDSDASGGFTAGDVAYVPGGNIGF